MRQIAALSLTIVLVLSACSSDGDHVTNSATAVAEDGGAVQTATVSSGDNGQESRSVKAGRFLAEIVKIEETDTLLGVSASAYGEGTGPRRPSDGYRFLIIDFSLREDLTSTPPPGSSPEISVPPTVKVIDKAGFEFTAEVLAYPDPSYTLPPFIPGDMAGRLRMFAEFPQAGDIASIRVNGHDLVFEGLPTVDSFRLFRTEPDALNLTEQWVAEGVIAVQIEEVLLQPYESNDCRGWDIYLNVTVENSYGYELRPDFVSWFFVDGTGQFSGLMDSDLDIGEPGLFSNPYAIPPGGSRTGYIGGPVVACREEEHVNDGVYGLGAGLWPDPPQSGFLVVNVPETRTEPTHGAVSVLYDLGSLTPEQ